MMMQAGRKEGRKADMKPSRYECRQAGMLAVRHVGRQAWVK